MTAAFTVILPHKRNPGNDRALAICLDMLFTNTVNEFALSVDAAANDPLYPRINRMVHNAQQKSDVCVYLASDMFVAPGWDVPMYDMILSQWDGIPPFVTNVVVEPAVMSVSPNNYCKDFGKRPEAFNREAFEGWAQSDQAPMLGGEGWVVPVMFSRDRFLELGGLNEYDYADDSGFTNADELLFRRHKAAGGQVIRVKSYCYHLQRYSEPSQQEWDFRN